MYQYMLKSQSRSKLTWLEKKLKSGDMVTLKDSEDPEEWWIVLERYDTEMDKANIKNQWSNDRLEKVERYIKQSLK